MPSTTQLIATAEITINGTPLPRFNSIYLNQPFENHHTFEISLSPDMLPDRATVVRLDELADKFAGEMITIKFKQGVSNAGVVSSQQGQMFRGTVTSVKITKTQSTTTAIIISGTSPTILLCAEPSRRSFSEMTIKDIVRKLTDAVGLSSSIAPSLTIPLPYTVQYDEDTYTFLQRLAQNWGEWMYYDGESFIFGKDARPSSKAITLNLGVNLFDMDYALRVTPLNGNWMAYNYQLNKLNEAQSTAPVDGLQTYAKLVATKSEKLFKETPTLINSGLEHTNSTLQDVAQRNKAKQATELAVLQGRTPEMELKVGSLVKIKEDIYTAIDPKLGSVKQDTIDYGQFVITRLTHYIDARGVYQATFEAKPQDGTQPPVKYDLPLQIAQPEIGVVKFIDDPDRMGRVKVQFPWQESDNLTTPWIRVSHSMSGKEQGIYFIPELGENVLVNYTSDGPQWAFVQSTLYNFDEKPGNLLFNEDNNVKGIITRGGNHILINDETSKESIKIYNKDLKNTIELSLDGETTINIKSEGSIHIEAKDKITMKSKAIEFTADEEWKVKAGKTEISNDQGMKISANAKVEIAGQSGVKVEGASIDIEAQAQASIKANAQLALESSGQASLKGAVVMIN